jgi:hypothetical protein
MTFLRSTDLLIASFRNGAGVASPREHAEAKAEFKRLRELLNATTEARREERALA